MLSPANFDQHVALHWEALRPAERRVARVFQDNREEALMTSATALAAKSGVSDATVVRTAKALGFSGLDELRRMIAADLRQAPTITSRMNETLREVGEDPGAAFTFTLDIHATALQSLRRDIPPPLFATAVGLIATARRVVVFGIGPSSMLAKYLATQLMRIGVEALSLTRTGLLFADDLRMLRSGDALVALAYDHLYRELAVLLSEADRLRIPKVLLTDSLGPKLREHVQCLLPVARGRADMLSMHTATLGLLEALLVGIAARQPAKTIRSLNELNRVRQRVAGAPVDLPIERAAEPEPRPGRKRGTRSGGRTSRRATDPQLQED